MAAAPIAVLGDITVDTLGRIEAFPAAGEDCLSPSLEIRCGGVGANVAIALARFGVPVRLFGTVGADPFGDHALDVLKRAGVDVSHVARAPRVATGVMFIAIEPDGQRTIFGSRGANEELEPPGGTLADCAAAHLVGYSFLSPSGARAAGWMLSELRPRHGLISLDPGMTPSREIPRKILQVAKEVDILFAGSEEAMALTGERHAAAALRALARTTPCDIVLKLGARGCLIREAGQALLVPSFRVAVVDSTGAGDGFAAAFLRARAAGWPARDAALFGNAAGAAAASVVGAGESMPTAASVADVLRAGRFDDAWESTRVRVLERLQRDESG